MRQSANDPVVNDAIGRIREAARAHGSIAVLLTGGDGPLAAKASEAIRFALGSDPTVRFSTVVARPQAPAPDADTPGGHVQAVAFEIAPRPDLVVHTSEAGGRLHVAARNPGRDPLGPADEGWIWVLSAP